MPWVGMDFGKKVQVTQVQCIPRTDDNYMHYGDQYELKYWDSTAWKSLGTQITENNSLIYDNAPLHVLFWLSN
ncbi:MAG: hypothetical protein LUD15_00290, partial [Bacteroides sp.]|nr:hypothetical protein [Bacteroides sp.]